MDAGELEIIVGSIQTEFKTFKREVFGPMAESVKTNTDKTALQGEHIAENKTDIKTLKTDVKENRGSLWRLAIIVITGLVTILAAVIAVKATGG